MPIVQVGSVSRLADHLPDRQKRRNSKGSKEGNREAAKDQKKSFSYVLDETSAKYI